MSSAQTVSTLSAVAAAAGALVLAYFLPFSFLVNGIVAILAFWIVSGLGRRYFLRHATAEEIRRDLEDRKNAPG